MDSSTSPDSSPDSETDSSSQDSASPPVKEPQTLLPEDPALTWIGRWGEDKDGARWASWAGSSVAFEFEGVSVSVVLDTGRDAEYFRVVVDGDAAGAEKIRAAPGESTLELATDLAYGLHRIELVKETNISLTTLRRFEWVGSGRVESIPEPSYRIEFYGDSNLAGYSLEHEENHASSAYVGCHFTYAGITARMFNAHYHNLSWSGSRIDQVHSIYDALDLYRPMQIWDFSQFVPDAVVINLGANDIYGASKQTIKERYHAMLDSLRATHPDAHVVLYNGYGWDSAEPANYTWEVIEERKDSNMSVATFPWVFEQWHGCEYDHGGMASILARHLEETLGWKAGPQDVMSGYGEGGDLANGSFEEIAPFGGYGWRYISETGASRILDASQAHSGEAFLELREGAEAHQPNPASDGQTVTVRAWVRAAAAGQTLKMTLDFRDQTMWTRPLSSTEEVFTLTEDWQEITLSAVAPAISGRPVFHTRLTLQAGEDSVVHLDDLSMTTTD